MLPRFKLRAPIPLMDAEPQRNAGSIGAVEIEFALELMLAQHSHQPQTQGFRGGPIQIGRQPHAVVGYS